MREDSFDSVSEQVSSRELMLLMHSFQDRYNKYQSGGSDFVLAESEIATLNHLLGFTWIARKTIVLHDGYLTHPYTFFYVPMRSLDAIPPSDRMRIYEILHEYIPPSQIQGTLR